MCRKEHEEELKECGGAEMNSKKWRKEHKDAEKCKEEQKRVGRCAEKIRRRCRKKYWGAEKSMVFLDKRMRC